jgi:signal transduction histidine kinase
MLVQLREARRKAQERVSYLEKIAAQLKALNRLKSEFVVRTSHQLRTPLNRIKWGLQSVLDGEKGSLTKEQKEFIEKILESSQGLISLVGRLLDVSKIEEGKFLYKKKTIEILPIIKEVISQYAFQIKEKKISVTIQENGYQHQKVVIDPKILELVLRNVIDNAVIYNKPEGSITISFKVKNDNLLISVRDTGIGIPKKELSFIFQRFYRASNAAKYVADGMGLGLSLSKEALKTQGGEISIVSKEGEGTEVIISLPLSQ